MKDKNSADWWMWQMYREVAHLIHFPSEANENRLKSLISEYRRIAQQRAAVNPDPHECAMDYV